MKKRWFLVGVMLLLAALLVGCFGVPKEDYEAVVTERDSALAELQSVKSQLNSVQAEASNLEAEVSNLEAEVSNLEAEVSNLDSELASRLGQLGDVEQVLDSLEPKLKIQHLLGEYMTKQGWARLEGSTLEWSDWVNFARRIFRLDIQEYLEDVDDYALRIQYDHAITWREEGWTTKYDEYYELLILLNELIEDDTNDLRTVLVD